MDLQYIDICTPNLCQIINIFDLVVVVLIVRERERADEAIIIIFATMNLGKTTIFYLLFPLFFSFFFYPLRHHQHSNKLGLMCYVPLFPLLISSSISICLYIVLRIANSSLIQARQVNEYCLFNLILSVINVKKLKSFFIPKMYNLNDEIDIPM
jgi:hypothetical protein